jgi:hypothetical protein
MKTTQILARRRHGSWQAAAALLLATGAATATAACVAGEPAPQRPPTPGDDDTAAAPETPAEAATLAALSAANTAQLVQDLGDFVGGGFTGAGGGLGDLGFGALPRFAAPGGCSAQLSIDGREVELAADCTLPSGRHVQGSLLVGLGGECGLGGLSVDFDLLVESQVGAGDEVRVRGHVALKRGVGTLYLATRLEHESHLGERDVETQVGACVVLDLPRRLVAMDGIVSLRIDAELVALFRVSDLQHLLCEPLPYTGTIHVQHRDRIVEVRFDRETPKTGVVTVVSDAGTVRVELPVPLGGLCAGGQIPPPLDIDYASCGGCDSPVPPPGDPDDPIPEPPPVD